MDKYFFRGVRIGFGFLFVMVSFFVLIYATGFHPASDIISGVFQGNYDFNGSVIIQNELNVSQNITINGERVYGGLSLPIGSIIAWHKTFNNTPSLLGDWLEANGQIVNDSQSPYYNLTLPNLNNDTQDGSVNSGMFLRGASSSGTFQSDATSLNSITATYNGFGWTTYRPNYMYGSAYSNNAGYMPGTELSSRGVGFSGADTETRPASMSVVWIIKIK